MKEIYAHYLMTDNNHLRMTLQYPDKEADEKLKSLRQYPLWFQVERNNEKYMEKVRRRIYTTIKVI